MSTTAVKEFYKYVLTQIELQKQINAVAEKNNKEELLELVVNLGQENGYHFSASDVEAAATEVMTSSEELSDEQLEAVAGGYGKPEITSSTFIGFGLFGPFFYTESSITAPTAPIAPTAPTAPTPPSY